MCVHILPIQTSIGNTSVISQYYSVPIKSNYTQWINGSNDTVLNMHFLKLMFTDTIDSVEKVQEI